MIGECAVDGCVVDHNWNNGFLRHGKKEDMTVSQCECRSGRPGMMIPTADRVHCEWCGRNLFEDQNTTDGYENSVSKTAGLGYEKAQAAQVKGLTGYVSEEAKMREFTGGATRSPQDNKPEFAGFLSPIALRRFGKYMMVHQKQEDGKLRKSDNWKKGMPRRVYLESLLRHTFDVWEEVTADIHSTRPDRDKLEEALCAIMFNSMGLLREVMLGRDVGDEKKFEFERGCNCIVVDPNKPHVCVPEQGVGNVCG